MACELQIGEQLCLMEARELIDSFQFQYDGGLDQHIITEAEVEFATAKPDWYRALPVVTQTGVFQSDAQTFLVNRLQQTWPQLAMHVDAAADDAFSKRIQLLG